jgi:hypothetical protein
MQTPRLRPKNLGKKKKPSNKPKLRPAGLGATKEEMDAMDRGFRIQNMEGREREDVKKKAYGGKVKKMAYGGKVKKMGMGGGMVSKCRGMGKATQGGNYSKMG